MKTFFMIVQTISAILLVGMIIVQSKGTGFGRQKGGSVSFTRRGLEKLIFKATFIVAAVFILVSTLQLII